MRIAHRCIMFVISTAFANFFPSIARTEEPSTAAGTADTTPIRQVRASVITSYGVFGEVTDAIDVLQLVGATRLSDYGTDQIWSVPHDKIETVSRFRFAELHPEWDTIDTGRVIDTRIPGVMTPTVGHKLVQFLAPFMPEDVEAIKATGCRTVQTRRYNAWQVWAGTTEAAEALLALECARNPICYRADFDPVALTREEFRESKDDRPITWDLMIVHDPARIAADAAHLSQIPGATFSAENLSNVPEYQEIVTATMVMPPSRVAIVLALPSVMRLSQAAGVSLMGEPESLISANQTHVIANPNQPPGTTWEVPRLPAAGGTRYAPWLEGKLTTDGNPHFDVPGEYPIVVVTDNGAGNGLDPGVPSEAAAWASDGTIPDFRVKGDEPSGTTSSRIAYSMRWDAHANGEAGAKFTSNDGVNTGFAHGHGVASVLGGYSSANVAARQNNVFLNYGMGVSPFGRLGNVLLGGVGTPFVVNLSGGSFGNMVNTYATDVNDRNKTPPNVPMYTLYRAHPTLISNNSWGVVEPANRLFKYDEVAREADFRVRDAISTGRHQPLLFLAAGGNSADQGYNTIVSPGMAKNAVTVGMSESVHQHPPALESNDMSGLDARNIHLLSSASGPGERVKPDLVAPGGYAYVNRHSSPQGSQGNPKIPDTVAPSEYTYAEGTSYATPQVAGAAQVACKFLRDRHGIVNPSPALLKAYLIMSAKFLTGLRTGENTPDAYKLPTRWQGFGRINLSRILELDANGKPIPTYFHDQRRLLAQNGEFTVTGSISDPARPFRAVLVWTDPPSDLADPPGLGAIINNLDLSITMPGVPIRSMRGNNFVASTDGSEAVTIVNKFLPTGFDTKNNVEAIFRPDFFGTEDVFTVKVRGATVARDCYNEDGGARQDFALVLYNFIPSEPVGTAAERFQDTDVAPPDLMKGEWAHDFGGARSLKWPPGGSIQFTPSTSPAPANTDTLSVLTSAPTEYASWEIDGTSGPVGGRIYRAIWKFDAALVGANDPDPTKNPYLRFRCGSGSSYELGQSESIFQSTSPVSFPTGANLTHASWLAPKLTPDGVPLQADGIPFDRPIYSMDVWDFSTTASLAATLKRVRVDSFAREDLIPDPVTPIVLNWGAPNISGTEDAGETNAGLANFSVGLTHSFGAISGTPPAPSYSNQGSYLVISSGDANPANMWMSTITDPTNRQLSNNRLYLVDIYINMTPVGSDLGPILRCRVEPTPVGNTLVSNFDLSKAGGSNPAALQAQGSARKYTMAFQPSAPVGTTHQLKFDLLDPFTNRIAGATYIIERVVVRSYLAPPVVD